MEQPWNDGNLTAFPTIPKVVIDPGHGGTDSGAVSGSFREKDLTLRDAIDLRNYLQANYVITVLMTRTSDVSRTLSQRTNYANNNNANLFVSLHYNAFNGSARGYEDFVHNGLSSTSRTHTVQRTIHNAIRNSVLNPHNIPNRGMKIANFHVLRETRMSAVLLEALFIDNRTDQSLMNNTTWRTRYIQSIGDAIAQTLNAQRRSGSTPTPPSAPNGGNTRTIFRVQVGAFGNRQNAVNMQQRLQRDGYNSFLVHSGGLYRVNVGSFGVRANADRLATELRNRGYSTFITTA